MANKYYLKNKKRIGREAHERYQNLSEEEKNKRQKKPEKEIKISLERKKKKSVNIIVNVIKILLRNLTTEETTI